MAIQQREFVSFFIAWFLDLCVNAETLSMEKALVTMSSVSTSYPSRTSRKNIPGKAFSQLLTVHQSQYKWLTILHY